MYVYTYARARMLYHLTILDYLETLEGLDYLELLVFLDLLDLLENLESKSCYPGLDKTKTA